MGGGGEGRADDKMLVTSRLSVLYASGIEASQPDTPWSLRSLGHGTIDLPGPDQLKRCAKQLLCLS